jgi:hypothetical protein
VNVDDWRLAARIHSSPVVSAINATTDRLDGRTAGGLLPYQQRRTFR